ncbi:fibronectin type III domain-containing protein [Actinoplanes palleronii]|uniref:Fibronectin type-III domain-containing protein n=1 Tax=Actinoplanes palleronii TaxID=113570 RepID=A0ABQ4BNR2_9ACTN|nr:fibronectin type III domain-containing protein [Actinoplanes palleronii]GIE72322.1 hypothetical protein Apa02nite_084300 [Actinoplanes palleronii]
MTQSAVGRSALVGLLVAMSAVVVVSSPAQAVVQPAQVLAHADFGSGSGHQPGRVRVSPDGSRVWAVDLGDPGGPAQILKLDVSTETSPVWHTVAPLSGQDPYDIAYSSDNQTMYVTMSGGAGLVAAVDATTGAELTVGMNYASPWTIGDVPTAITVARVGSQDVIYVAASDAHKVYALNATTGLNVMINTSFFPTALTASSDGTRVFVGGSDGGIRQIATGNNTIGASVVTAHSTTIQDLVLTPHSTGPDSEILLAAGGDGSTTGYIDAYSTAFNSLGYLSSITRTDEKPFTQLAATRDGRAVYGASGGGTISARLNSYEISAFLISTLHTPPRPVTRLASVSSLPQAWGVAASPTLSRLYVTTRGDAGVSADLGSGQVVQHPDAPGAPGLTQALSGSNRAVRVSWLPAVPGSSTVTGYDVVSVPGSRRCHTDGALFCWVTGLDNTVSYDFVVTATSAAGTGNLQVSTGSGVPQAAGYPYHLNFFAGNGLQAITDTGGAAAQPLYNPSGVTADAAGNVYLADAGDSLVTKVAAGQISIVAGLRSGGGFPTLDGPATASRLLSPRALAVAANGDLYIADYADHRVEKVSGGIITAFAGTGTGGTPIAGPATSSPLGAPGGLALDTDGNLYIADTTSNQVVRVDQATGVLSIVAGTGVAGASIPAALATASPLRAPRGVAADACGNVFIADTGNYQVLRVDAGTGRLSVVAGSGQQGFPLDGTLAATSALGEISSLAIGPEQALYLADRSNNVIERFDTTAATPELQVIVGSGALAAATDNTDSVDSDLALPHGVAVRPDDGKIYIADSLNYRVHQLTPPDRVPGPPAGLTAQPGNGTATLRFSAPVYTGGSGVPLNNPDPYEYSTDGITWTTLTTTPGGPAVTGTVTGLVNGRTYEVRVRARNAVGTGLGLPSRPVRITPDVVPSAPAVPAVQAGDRAVTVTWAAPTNPGSPLLEYVVTPYLAGVAQPSSRYPSTSTTATITGLTAGTAYTFRVEATNSAGVSPPSLPSTEVRPSGPSPSPSISASPTTSPTVSPSPSTSTPTAGPTPTPTATPSVPAKLKLDLHLKSDEQLAGSRASISGGGLKGSSPYTLTMHSTPVVLASGRADAAGHFSAGVTMPRKACVSGGLHRLVLTGVAPDGSVVADTSWVVLDDTCTAQTGAGTAPPHSVVGLGSVLFPYLGAKLPPTAKRFLKVKDGAMGNAGLITLTGYTQTGRKSKAAIAATRRLSLKRAIVVRDYLRALGVRAPIKVVGVGGQLADKKKQKYNRRVVITVRY